MDWILAEIKKIKEEASYLGRCQLSEI